MNDEYICLDCGAIFSEPVKGYEEEKDSCPNCGSWGFEVYREEDEEDEDEEEYTISADSGTVSVGENDD